MLNKTIRGANVFDYDVVVDEINAETVRVEATNYKHRLVKYYTVKGNFNQYMNKILPQLKVAIIDMERGLNV